MLSVLFVESYPDALAGQQKTLTALLDRAAIHEMRTTILAPSPGAFADKLSAQGYDVDTVPQPSSIGIYGGAIYRYGLIRKLKMVQQGLQYLKQLRSYLLAGNFQAVFCNDLRGLLTVGFAARTVGLPVMIWDKLDKPHGFYDWFQLPIANRNLMISEGIKTKYPIWQRKLWRDRLKVVRDGISTTQFVKVAQSDVRRALGLTPSQVVLAIIGTVTERKGHDLILAAFRRAKETQNQLHLLVVGAPDESSIDFAAKLQASATEGVSWLGYREDIHELLSAIDILASPSRHEGMGRVNIEAMACEIPVIGSLGTGIAEVVVDGETGLLVDPSDTEALSDAIIRLSADPDLRRRMGRCGRARVLLEFDVDKQIDTVLEEIRKMVQP